MPDVRALRALIASALLAACAAAAAAQQSSLGRVDFPVTTASEQARTHFLRGVAALHSFWFEEALEAFRESTRLAPDFAMGYWGEAMAHNHPLWAEQDADSARRALAKIGDTSRLTARERAYLDAVRVLYGEGDKQARDAAYASAMEKVYRAYPEDLEAAALYALSLLGTVRPGEKGFARQMKAGAVALDVYAKNPDHPGAAHYIIHAFDDPEHAVLALPAARRYAEIAPEAHHARHMPSHIFIQLGMWPDAARSNESAWAASEAWVRRKNLGEDLRDYHSLHWLTYSYLQQGRHAKAGEALATFRRAIAAGEAPRARRGYPASAAAFVVETERWDAADELFSAAPPQAEPARPAPAAHAHDAGGAGNAPSPYASFARGLAAVARRRFEEAAARAAELRAARAAASAGDAYRARQLEIMELEVAAALDSARGRHAEAVEQMRRAAALEEEMSPPSGPPDVIKPSHEMLGEVLLRAGRAPEAAEQFAASLRRQPNRTRSLLGAARAAALSGDRARAASLYAELLRVLEQADDGLPEAREARDFVGRERPAGGG